MLQPQTRLVIRELTRRIAVVCDSRMFLLAVVVLLVSLLLPLPSARTEDRAIRNARGLPSLGVGNRSLMAA